MRIADTYVEIIGNVKDDLTVKALTSINMGSKLGE
jgi:replication factor A3